MATGTVLTRRDTDADGNASNIIRDEYMLSRGYASNTRVNIQHYLWKDGLDYLIHPSIPTNSANLRIAEIGVGTGIWLTELSRTLPSAQLDGFDVSHAQCPPPEFMPPNVSLYIHDCLSEPPTTLIQQYDIIHIQMFNSVVKDNDPVPVVRNMLKMLKPGGFISWGEFDFASWKTVGSSTSGAHKNLDELLRYNATVGDTRPVNFLATHWPRDLPEIFSNLGMTHIEVERTPFSPEVATYLVDTFLMAAEEISYNVLDRLGGGQGDVARSLIERVMEERRNMSINLDRLVTVGRKAI